MMSFYHGWGRQPPQTASCIHIRHTQSVWAHWYAVHGHMAVASNSYTHLTWLIFWDSGSHLWSQNDVIMSCLRLTATSTTASHIHIRHIQNVWAYWYAVQEHEVAAFNSYTHTTWLMFGGSKSLVESKSCHYVTVLADSQLKLLPKSTLDIYKVFCTLICCPWAFGSTSNSDTQLTWVIFWGSGSLVESKWCHYVMVLADSQLKMLPTSTLNI